MMMTLTLEENRLLYSIKEKYSKNWDLNDPAHRYEHFWEVMGCGLEINQDLGLGEDRKLIIIAAMFHDLFAWSRENHHVLSKTFIEGTECPILLPYLSNRESPFL